MAKQVQFRRGSNTENDTFTGAVGEITVDTTTNSLRVHDGTTAGGTALGSYTKPAAEPITYITGLQTALDDKLDDSQIGILANQIVQLDSNTKLPAVDGSQLTNLPDGIADVEGLQNALDGKVNADANIDLLTYTEKYITIGMDGIINLSLGTVFTHDHAHATSGNMTAFTVSSVPTTGTSGFILILENGGSYPLDWWTGSGGAVIKWPAATPPTLTAAGIDIFTFTTPDSGVTWYGIPSGIGMA